MDPFEVLARRGHILESDGDVIMRTTTHGGPNDDYDAARGPSRSLTARSDKQLTQRDMRMPMDLSRSRRVGLSRTACGFCGAVKDQGVCHHAVGCVGSEAEVIVNAPDLRWTAETTGPMAPNETSAEVGWH